MASVHDAELIWNWQLQFQEEPLESPWQFSEAIAAGCSDSW